MANKLADANEVSVASQLPYSQQISPHTVITNEGDWVSTIQAHGINFDTMPNSEIDSLNRQWFNTINSMLTEPRQAMWTHIVRSKSRSVIPPTEYSNYFSDMFMKEYNSKIAESDFYTNRLYLSPVVRMAGTKADRAAMKLSKKDSESYAQYQEQVQDLHERFIRSLTVSTRRYFSRPLGTYLSESGYNTEIGELYSHLLNHSQSRIALQPSNFSQTLQKSFLDFGRESIRIVHPQGESYAAILTLIAPYTCETINAKVMEPLLTADFEFVLSQSFTTLPPDAAERGMKAQKNRFSSTSGNDLQIKEIDDAIKLLQAGNLKVLDHEWILVVYGESLKDLGKNVSEAIELLSRKSIQVSREIDGALIATFYSIFPGNFEKGRVRSRPITSPNMAKFFPMHNYPNGNRNGSQWGNPIMVMTTESRNPYYVNWHVNRDRLAEQGITLDDAYADDDEDTNKHNHRKEIGNFVVVGESGGGKTTLKAAMRAALMRKPTDKNKKPKIFAFDKDNGEEILMRALGGKYFNLQPGSPTGINVFQWPETDANKELIHELATWAAEFGGQFSLRTTDSTDLKMAIDMVYELPREKRRFSKIIQGLPSHTEDSLWGNLKRWCYDPVSPKSRPYAWILDSEHDQLSFNESELFGFDVTGILPFSYAKTPIMRMITEKILQSAAGTPHVIDIAEAWAVLDDPLMGKFIENKSRTIRKQDGVLGLDTQNPEDIVGSSLGKQFLNQFPTSFILPNAKAKPDVYIDGFGLTPREYQLVKNARPDQGEVLIKKGTESILAKMNLSGMNDMLAVLSSSTDNVQICRECVAEFGDNPKIWLPEFFKRRV